MGKFGIIPEELFAGDLSPAQISLYVALSLYADKDGYCYPSYETLAGKLNRTKGWVSTNIKSLESSQIIKIEQRGCQKYGFRLLLTVQPTKQPFSILNGTVQPAKQNNTNEHNHKRERRSLTTIPADFRLTDDLIAYLKKERPDLNAEEFHQHFVLQCEAKGYRYKNWKSAWKAWVRREKKSNAKTAKTTREYGEAWADALECSPLTH